MPSRSGFKEESINADSKVGVMRQMFPKHSEKIVNDPANRTIFDVLKKAHNDGYSGVRVVGGADRQKEFDKLVNTYNGKLYKFDKVEVVSAGDRDPDADDVTGMSHQSREKQRQKVILNLLWRVFHLQWKRKQQKNYIRV